LFPEKILLKHISKKNLASLKKHFAPQNLNPGYGPSQHRGVEHTQCYVSAVHNCKNIRLRECVIE